MCAFLHISSSFTSCQYFLSLTVIRRHSNACSSSCCMCQGGYSIVCREICIQHPYPGRLASHASRLLLTEDPLWAKSARVAFPSLTINPFQPGGECSCRPQCQKVFLSDYHWALHATLRFSELSHPRKTMYWVLVEGSISDPLCGLSVDELHSLCFWAPAAADYIRTSKQGWQICPIATSHYGPFQNFLSLLS